MTSRLMTPSPFTPNHHRVRHSRNANFSLTLVAHKLK